jgi:hypothetical protein
MLCLLARHTASLPRHYRSYGGYSLLRLLTLPSYAAGLWQLHLAWGSVLRLLRLLYLQ